MKPHFYPILFAFNCNLLGLPQVTRAQSPAINAPSPSTQPATNTAPETPPAVALPTVPSVSFPPAGTVAPRSASEIKSSNWSVGGETLDRDYSNYDEYKKYLGPLGAKAIRFQGGWAKTETEKGVYHWEWLDKVIDDARAQGLHPWLELSYGNPLYTGGGTNTIGSPLPVGEAVAAWDAWARAAVQRYKDRVDAWEIWNEPDYFRVSLNDYVAFYIRTAQMIRQEAPNTRIYALSLAGLPSYGDKFLDQLDRQGKLDLVDAITFHAYPHNPDDMTNWLALKKAVAKHQRPIELREGETGSPSRRTTGALGAFSWTQTTQAKWDLRRMLQFHGNGVAFNLFTISDFLYPNGMNTKGLLEARKDHTIVGPKPSYLAAQNVFSIFDDTVKPTGPIEIKPDPATPLAVLGYTKEGTGMSLVTVWENGAPPVETNSLHETDLDLAQTHFEKPVYVDLFSGKVFEIPKENWSQDNGVSHFKKIPLYDSPILIADRSTIKMNP